MRFTEHNETPARRATSVFRWPAFNKISTSRRFNILSILLPPGPPRRTDRETHRKGFTVYGVSGMAQNFRNEMAQIFRNSQKEAKALTRKTRRRASPARLTLDQLLKYRHLARDRATLPVR